MPNAENLIPNSQRTREELQENGRKGGIQAGISKRQSKSLRACASLLMALPVEDKRKLAQLVKKGVPPEDCNNSMLLVYTAFKMAVSGSPKWGKMLFDLLDKEERQADGDLGGSPLEVFLTSTSEDMDTDDLPEVQ